MRKRLESDFGIDVRRAATGNTVCPTSLSDFVHATTNITLDAWQLHLCERLEKLADQTGQRLLIHAPPQMGKSIIVSQRFPAWLLARKPDHKIKLTCYNITHATRFSRINREIIEGEQWQGWYPKLKLAGQNTQEEWSLSERAKAKDAQPSFKALGLATGFVGQGADTLIIDDPYSSPQDAFSEAIRASVMMFWEDSAKVRLTDGSNVVVMFHRYHLQDLAGELMAREGLKQDGGAWELLRYPMLCDDEASDPMGRRLGESLSPRYSEQWIADKQSKATTWKGQFQGLPIAGDGLLFKTEMLRYCEPHQVPDGLTIVRAWDKAASEGKGDWTAGVKMGRLGDTYYVLDVVRGQWEPNGRNNKIRNTAERDGHSVRIRGAQDPGSAGVDDKLAFIRLLSGYTVTVERVTGDKELRAEPMASQVNGSNFVIVRGEWNREFVNEMQNFPQGEHDDQIDAASDAFSELSKPQLRSRVA